MTLSADAIRAGAECPVAKVRVFLADDHAMLRSVVRLLVDAQPDLEVVGEAGDGQAAVDQVLAAPGQVDVVVLDISMPRLNGLEALRQIKAAVPQVAVLILSMHVSEPYLAQIVEAGGAGYVPKGTAGDHLLDAIRDAAAGRPFWFPTMEARRLAAGTGGAAA